MKEDNIDPPEVTRNEAEGDWLDREHQARLSRVESCDSAEGQKAQAEVEMGVVTEEVQGAFGERNAQGSDEYVNAIRRSGWFPYAEALHNGARLSWLLDMMLWSALWFSIVLQLVRVYAND